MLKDVTKLPKISDSALEQMIEMYCDAGEFELATVLGYGDERRSHQ